MDKYEQTVREPNVLSPEELYQMPPIAKGYDLWRVLDALPELSYQDEGLESNKRVEICTYADHSFDGERGWMLCSIWLDDKPFMVYGNAGRGGRYDSVRFVTDVHTYIEAVTYLRSLLRYEEQVDDVVDAKEPIAELTNFYGCSLEDFYVPETVNPKWKVGDIVFAKVKENHLKWNSDKVVTRVIIEKVSPHNPTLTYHATQIDRVWDDAKEWKDKKIIEKPGQGLLGAQLAETDVIGEAPREPFPEKYKNLTKESSSTKKIL